MATTALAPPTEQYLLQLKGELEEQFATQDSQIDRTRKVRELQQPVTLEQKVTDVEVRDPDVAAEIGRRSAILAVNDPLLRVTPAKGDDASEDAKTNSTLREEWTQETLKVAGRRVAGMDTFQRAVDCQVGDGAAWTKLLFQRDLWDERYRLRREPLDDDGNPVPGKGRLSADEYDQATEAAKQNAGPPFVWANVDPRTIYPLWSGTRLTEVMEITKRPIITALRQHRLKVEGGEIVPDELGRGSSTQELDTLGGNTSEVTFIEHWDNTWCTYLIIGGSKAYQIAQWKHGYGQVPYFQAPGLMFGYWVNRKVGWGVGEMKRWLVEYRSFLRTVMANIVAIEAFKPMQDVSSDNASPILGPDGKPKQTEQWNLRQIMYTGPGHEVKAIPVTVDPTWLLKEIELTDEAILALSSPRLPNQLGSGMEGAGFAIATVIAEAKLQDDPFCKGMARMLSDVTRFLWRLVKDKARETVWVRGESGGAKFLSLGPDDLKDGVGVDWEIDPERPTGKLIEEQYHAKMVQDGFESMDQAIEAQGGNPDAVRRGRDLDEMRADPRYKNFKLMQTFQKSGMGHLLMQDQVANQVAETGNLPPPTAPGVPPGAGPQGPQRGPPAVGAEGAVVPGRDAAALAGASASTLAAA